jgi:type IV secretion system protein VirD4
MSGQRIGAFLPARVPEITRQILSKRWVRTVAGGAAWIGSGYAAFCIFSTLQIFGVSPATAFLSWRGLSVAVLVPLGVMMFVALVLAKADEIAAGKITHPGSLMGQALRDEGLPRPRSPATNASPPRPDEATHDTPKGNSKFASLADVRRSGLWTAADIAAASDRDQGPYLGQFLEGARASGVIRYTGPKHLISIGPPGSNKSVGLAVPNIANLPRSMIIMDCKGQLAAMTARKRAEMGRVIVINPFDLFVDEMPHLRSHGFNPMASLDPASDRFASGATGLAENLIPIDPNEHQKIFPEGARNLYAAAIMHERMTKGEAANLAGVRRALCAPSRMDPKTKEPISGFQKLLYDMAMSDYPPIANLAGPLFDRFQDQSSGNTSAQDTIGTALTKTKALDEPAITRDLQGPGIDFGKFREEITTCYIILPTAELVNQGVWLRLLIGSALRALYQTPLPSSDKALPPVYFLLDEFAALGRLEAIETALGVARDYGIQLHVMLQYLSQIKDLYPQRWHGFFSGAGAVAAFAPRDWETAEFLAKFCGERTTTIQSSNVGLGQDGKVTPGQSWSPQTQPLIRPEDLTRMPRGRMLCLIEPEGMPFFTQAPVYTETPFAAGLDDNPYFRKPSA